MNAPRLAVLLLALVVIPGLLAAAVVLSPDARAATTAPVTGSISGPTIVATQSTTPFSVRGFGGPAVSANGTVVGNITYYVRLLGPNLTGVTFSPTSSTFTSNTSRTADLAVGNTTETITVDLEVSSVYKGENQSVNSSYPIHVVQPYIVSATIVAHASWVTAFTLWVTLDGGVIGNVSVPALSSGGTYAVKFTYATLGLSPGDHTFGLSLVQEHGLVTFANGQTQYTETVYVTGPAPDYTLWYIAGIVAFFGAIFIFVTRVAARRRGVTRR